MLGSLTSHGFNKVHGSLPPSGFLWSHSSLTSIGFLNSDGSLKGRGFLLGGGSLAFSGFIEFPGSFIETSSFELDLSASVQDIQLVFSLSDPHQYRQSEYRHSVKAH